MNGDVRGEAQGSETSGSSQGDLDFVPPDLVTCRACAKLLTSPRLLPCYHTVCSSCLDNHITAQIATNGNTKSFPCPVCSAPIKLPTPDQQSDKQSYAAGFEPDTFVEKLLDVLSAFKEDKSCDLCQRREITQPAADWCMECLDAMCDACLKVHLCGKMSREHTVVSLPELRKLSLGSVLRRGMTQACRSHVTEVVRFFCLDCRLPACVQCLTERHRKCDKCLPLAEAMTSMNDHVADVMVRMRSVRDRGSQNEAEIEDAKTYKSSAHVLEESIQEADEKIRSLAEELRQIITKKEQELLERLYSVASQLQEKVGDFQNIPNSQEDDVKTLASAHDRLETLMKYGSDVEVLELYQAVQGPLSRVEGSDPASLAEDEVRLTVKFSPDDLVQSFGRDLQTLGEISVQDSSSDEGLGAWGVAVTDSDDIIVVDCRNRRIQKFGLSGDLLDHIQVSVEPRDVTSCGASQQQTTKGKGSSGGPEEEVAVTMMGKQVYVITVADKMALKRRFKTTKQYDSISFSSSSLEELTNGTSHKTSPSGFFLVSSLEERCIDVISLEGDVMKTFGGDEPATGISKFLSPRYVAVTRDCHFVVSDAGHSCVVCFTQDGGAQFRYAPEGSHEVTSPQGVCSDKFGNLFLADYGNSRIHMVTTDGDLERFVLGPESGLRRPVATAMTPRSSKLVIVQSDGVVKVFSYGDTKVKMKVPCWCPRCSTSTDDGEVVEGQGLGHDVFSPGVKQYPQGSTVGSPGPGQGWRSRTRSGASLGSTGSGSPSTTGSRSGSESAGPFSPTSPMFPSPKNCGFKRY